MQSPNQGDQPVFIQHRVAITALVVYPLLLMLITRSWLLMPLGIDAWVYYGYVREPAFYLAVFSGYYIGARLPVIVPAHFAHNLLGSPVLYAYATHLTICILSLLALYFIVSHLFNRRAGLITALLMGSYWPFLLTQSGYYIDNVINLYMLLTLVFLIQSLSGKRVLWLTLAGGAWMGACLSNLFVATFTPGVILFYAIIVFRQPAPTRMSIRTLLLNALWVVVGAVAYLVLLGVVNVVAFQDNFLFFLDGFNFISSFTQNTSPYIPPQPDWPLRMAWLGLPLAMLILVLVRTLSAFRQRPAERSYPGLAVNSLYLWIIIAYLIINFVFRQPLLGISYYVTLMLPYLFMALGAALTPTLQRFTHRQILLLVPCVAMLGAGWFAATKWLSSSPYDTSGPPLALAIHAGGVLLSFALFYAVQRTSTILKWLALIGVSLAVLVHGYYGQMNQLAITPADELETFIALASESIDTVERWARTEGMPYQWSQANTPLEVVVTSASGFWGWTVMGGSFEAADGMQNAQIAAGKPVVLVAEGELNTEPLLRTLETYDLTYEVSETRMFSYHETSVTLQLVHLVPLTN